MVATKTALPAAAPQARSALDCSGCVGSVPTRSCLHTGAVQHVGAGYVLACSASRTQPLPRDWFIPAPASPLHTPALRPLADDASMATTQRITFNAAAELAKWSVPA